MQQFAHPGSTNIRHHRGTKYFRPGFVHPWCALSSNARVIGSKKYQIIIRIPLLDQQTKTYLCLYDSTLILTAFSSFQEFSSSGHFCNRLLKLFWLDPRLNDIYVFSVSVQAYVSLYSQQYSQHTCTVFQKYELSSIVAKPTAQDVYWHGFEGWSTHLETKEIYVSKHNMFHINVPLSYSLL